VVGELLTGCWSCPKPGKRKCSTVASIRLLLWACLALHVIFNAQEIVHVTYALITLVGTEGSDVHIVRDCSPSALLGNQSSPWFALLASIFVIGITRSHISLLEFAFIVFSDTRRFP